MQKKIAIVFCLMSIIAWLIDRFTGSISSMLGKYFCQAIYLKSFNGIIGDTSCGFNTDIYFAVVCYYSIFIFVASNNHNLL